MNMSERIQKRLGKGRTMTSISLRIPEDVIEDLKAVAPTLGFSGYQPLIKAYIGQGLRKDLARLENDQVKAALVANYQKYKPAIYLQGYCCLLLSKQEY